MEDMSDDALIAMALRNHAQTCDDIAEKSERLSSKEMWTRRAKRCRDLAKRYESMARPAGAKA